MRLSRFGTTVLAMGLVLPLMAQAQAPSGTHKGSATPQPPPQAAQTARPTAPAPAPSTSQAARPTTAPSSTAANSTSAQGKLVDINSAPETDLDALPGIGKSRADAIIKNRPYKGKDDLVARHIIPQNIYNGIKDKIIARQG
ncbi:MAG TPA: helix-hairpin-helix domain-containing protein [Acetobacteraceae bacterium]|nr:helix-hairpin-helix domain-containing protein [Acetobacteraceae bacterium]